MATTPASPAPPSAADYKAPLDRSTAAAQAYSEGEIDFRTFRERVTEIDEQTAPSTSSQAPHRMVTHRSQ